MLAAHVHRLGLEVVIGLLQFSPHISGLANGDTRTTSTEEDAESFLWNNMIAPLLQQLESVAAGSVRNAMRKPSEKVQEHLTYIRLD